MFPTDKSILRSYVYKITFYVAIPAIRITGDIKSNVAKDDVLRMMLNSYQAIHVLVT